MLGLWGGTATTIGLCTFNVFTIDALVIFVAVAVMAITLTFSGMMLRSFPRWENSRRKLSPLQDQESR